MSNAPSASLSNRPQETGSSYRPHNPGHDYHAPGIYLITLVVRNRRQQATLLGHLNDDIKAPGVVLGEVGKAVMECWYSIPCMQEQHNRHIKVHAAVCMPDHFHGVIEVMECMDVSVGEVIRGFKSGCTMAFRQWLSGRCSQPNMAVNSSASLTVSQVQPSAVALITQVQPSAVQVQPSAAQVQPSAAHVQPSAAHVQPYLVVQEQLKRMSKKQRAAYYAAHPEAQQPLWDVNYDDTICLSDPLTGAYDQRHLAAMLRYVDDNPRRAIMRRLRPQFMQRCLHVRLVVKDATESAQARNEADRTVVRDYAAFGNLFLLRWARKVQVFCHRKARYGMLTVEERARHCGGVAYEDGYVTRVPYEQTLAFRNDCACWKAQVMAGATVLVTPGISKGELFIKDRCLECGYPLIHLQKESIGPYWKPEQRRFDACCRGTLLILAPWSPDALGDVQHVPTDTDYSIFHNLNALASEICDFYGEAEIVKD